MAQTDWGNKKREKSHSLAKTKATGNQWLLLDIAIKEFIRKYPLEWNGFQKLLKEGRTKYGLAQGKEGLVKSNWRHTASFPVVYNAEGKEIDALLPVLEKIIPRLTHTDSVNYATFLRKYPVFMGGHKY